MGWRELKARARCWNLKHAEETRKLQSLPRLRLMTQAISQLLLCKYRGIPGPQMRGTWGTRRGWHPVGELHFLDALHRREREQTLARRAATAAIESELKSTVAGLLLHSQLALTGAELSAPMADRLRMVADLAGNRRQQLNAPQQVRADTAA